MKSRKKFLKTIAAGLSLGWLFTDNSQAANVDDLPANSLATEPYIGTVALFAFNFAPNGWMPCDGRLLSISEYDTLYSLLDTIYGGDGRTTFRLPDLRGRVPIGTGQMPGGSNYLLGAQGGTETNTLNEAQLPSHSHSLNVSGNPGTSYEAAGNLPAANRDGILHYAETSDNTMGNQAISATGSGQAVNNMQPYLSLNYCIAVTGLYPPTP
ncbi:phage tail protein [Gracilimonas halophila]|uniref:Phage tail protein n=1 Tax=Gracilimonas halophila TaxID=1834464 RepID=A0ABW5JJK4_9BACT